MRRRLVTRYEPRTPRYVLVLSCQITFVIWCCSFGVCCVLARFRTICTSKLLVLLYVSGKWTERVGGPFHSQSVIVFKRERKWFVCTFPECWIFVVWIFVKRMELPKSHAHRTLTHTLFHSLVAFNITYAEFEVLNFRSTQFYMHFAKLNAI